MWKRTSFIANNIMGRIWQICAKEERVGQGQLFYSCQLHPPWCLNTKLCVTSPPFWQRWPRSQPPLGSMGRGVMFPLKQSTFHKSEALLMAGNTNKQPFCVTEPLLTIAENALKSGFTGLKQVFFKKILTKQNTLFPKSLLVSSSIPSLSRQIIF